MADAYVLHDLHKLRSRLFYFCAAYLRMRLLKSFFGWTVAIWLCNANLECSDDLLKHWPH